MKKLLFAMCMLFAPTVWGQGHATGINGRIEFYDCNGNQTGYTKQNEAYGYWEYYDANGRKYKTKANVSEYRAEYYSGNGSIVGSEVYNEAYERIDCYDANGRKTGHQKYDDYFGQWEIFDQTGTKVANCKWNADKKLWEYKKLR